MTNGLAGLPAHLEIARTRCGPMLHFRNDIYIGRSLALYGEYCQAEADLLAKLVVPGGVVVEAGANIGSHTVGLAQALGPAGLLYAFEPQRPVFQMLCANLALNGLLNVDARNVGLGATPGLLHVDMPDYMGGIANFGSVPLSDTGHPVAVQTIDSLALSRLDLVKIDVEGMEDAVLHGATDTIGRLRPLLYVENDRETKSAALISLILNLNYRLWWHLPPLFNPGNLHGVGEDVFDGTVSVNMIGVPRERPTNVTGFREIINASSRWQDH